MAFCWMCERMRPNEAFSGRNHGRHLCRQCARQPRAERDRRNRLSFKRAHYADWVDHPLPALDGLSPLEATSNPGLRARLALLLKEMEELEERGPAGQRFDFGGIRRQLDMGDG